MDDELKAKMDMDAAKGESYQRAWDNIIQPFFDKMQAELYQAFVDTPTSHLDALTTIKMQSNVLTAMKDEMDHYINTGKLARKAIDEEESNGD